MLSKILERVPKEKQEVIKQCLDDNNSKMVLLSIRKCWLDKIATGEKTLELRKSAPKGIQFPFAVLCYESKTDGGCGKVKGILLVGGIRKIGKNAFLPMYTNNPESDVNRMARDSLVPLDEIRNYLGAGKIVYGWEVAEYFPIRDLGLVDLGVSRASQSWQYLV